MSQLEVLFTPADFIALGNRDLSKSTCVVFDVLRATSTMVTALAHGAESMIPVREISDALAIRNANPEVLLAGEREGLRISSELTGSIAFDLGNSPREFTVEMTRGKIIVITTTNGTRALQSCLHAERVLICSFLNLSATADFLLRENPGELILICAGTGENSSYEDVLGAGALCHRLLGQSTSGRLADSAQMALNLYLIEQKDLSGALGKSVNGRRLLSLPDLKEDVPLCSQLDCHPLVAAMDQSGKIRRLPA